MRNAVANDLARRQNTARRGIAARYWSTHEYWGTDLQVTLSILANSDQVRSWLESLATLAAVVVALFLQLWLPYLRRPKVRIKKGAQPDVTADGHGVIGRYYDLPIENIGRGEVAREVEVVLTGIFRIDAQNALCVTGVPHRALKWTHLWDGRADVPAGFTRSVMIGAAWPAEAGQDDKPLRFEVGTFPPFEHSKRHVLLPGRYRFELSVVAANARSRDYVFDLLLKDDTQIDLPGGVRGRTNHTRRFPWPD